MHINLVVRDICDTILLQLLWFGLVDVFCQHGWSALELLLESVGVSLSIVHVLYVQLVMDEAVLSDEFLLVCGLMDDLREWVLTVLVSSFRDLLILEYSLEDILLVAFGVVSDMLELFESSEWGVLELRVGVCSSRSCSCILLF